MIPNLWIVQFLISIPFEWCISRILIFSVMRSYGWKIIGRWIVFRFLIPCLRIILCYGFVSSGGRGRRTDPYYRISQSHRLPQPILYSHFPLSLPLFRGPGPVFRLLLPFVGVGWLGPAFCLPLLLWSYRLEPIYHLSRHYGYGRLLMVFLPWVYFFLLINILP